MRIHNVLPVDSGTPLSNVTKIRHRSMETLYRLCNLPVNKRIKGIVGGSNGRPLVNVRIEDVKVE